MYIFFYNVLNINQTISWLLHRLWKNNPSCVKWSSVSLIQTLTTSYTTSQKSEGASRSSTSHTSLQFSSAETQDSAAQTYMWRNLFLLFSFLRVKQIQEMKNRLKYYLFIAEVSRPASVRDAQHMLWSCVFSEHFTAAVFQTLLVDMCDIYNTLD